MSVYKNTWLSAVRLQDYDSAVFKTSIDFSIRVECDVFGFMAIAE